MLQLLQESWFNSAWSERGGGEEMLDPLCIANSSTGGDVPLLARATHPPC